MADPPMTLHEQGLLTLASIRAALANGVKHYWNGRLLATDKDILQMMIRREAVTLDESERQEVTTTEAIFEELKRTIPSP